MRATGNLGMADLFAPLRHRALLLSAVVLAVGVGASVAGQRLAQRVMHANAQARFASDAAAMSTDVGERLRTHSEVLVSMQGLYATVGRIDRAQFQRYVDTLDLMRRHPGFDSLEVLRKVAPEDLDSFIAEVRADRSLADRTHLDFTVHPTGARPAYFPIEFVEPLRGNETVLGFDPGSKPQELDSLARAADSGRIVATPPVKLVQDQSGGLGFILRVPIYRAGQTVQSVEQRRAALRGYAAAVYRMNDLMRGVLDVRTLQQMIVRVVDLGYAKLSAEGIPIWEPADPDLPGSLMFDSREPNLRLVTPVASVPIGISAERSLVVGDRLWRLHFAARAGSVYEVDRMTPRLVLAGGSVISLLLALVTFVSLRAKRLSGNLSALDAEQRALVENPLAGILFLRGRTVVRGNQRLAALCARERDSLEGLDMEALLDSPADVAAFEKVLATVQAGHASHAVLHLKGAEDRPVPVDAFARPLRDGRSGGGTTLWVVQDKTDALKHEAERQEHERALKAANARLTGLLDVAEARAGEITLLTELSGVLQSCHSLDEVFRSVTTYAARLFPDEAGALYVLNKARDQAVRGSRWGALKADVAGFAPDECWGLRRGRVFPESEASRGLVCNHVSGCCGEATPNYVCQPLFAQNTLLGLLYRETQAVGDAHAQQLATMLAEQVSLAIANIELREQLRGQALRDPLTGLANRRFLESALALEGAGSLRSGRPLALALLDLDHFKQINDTYSHEAGDAVLRAMGEVLREQTRATDIVGRYGGEEFLVLLPDTGLDGAIAVANHLLSAVRRLKVLWPGGVLDEVTVSVGLAVFPRHVERVEDLVAAADAALYQAKAEGRDRMVVARATVPDAASPAGGG